MNTVKSYHRWVGSVMALFFIVIATTGIAMQVDLFLNPPPPPPPVTAENAPPPVTTPQGIQWHYVLQDIHAGYYFGGAGKIINVICGMGLLVLSFTGLMVYWELLKRRIKTGRWQFFWR